VKYLLILQNLAATLKGLPTAPKLNRGQPAGLTKEWPQAKQPPAQENPLTDTVDTQTQPQDTEYRGPPAILNLEARDILGNRYSVTASGARKKGWEIRWHDFAHFFEHTRLYAPEEFDHKTWRVYYEQPEGQEPFIGPENVRYVETGKARLHNLSKKAKPTDVQVSNNHAQMIMLAAEIAGRLCTYEPGVSVQEILQESLAAAGVQV
jgi:hypothetical protein